MSRSLIHLAGTKPVHLLITGQVKNGGCGIFHEARTSVLVSLLSPGENAWCFETRHREDIKQLSDIEATTELWISTAWMHVLPLLPFQGSYSFVGFLNMSKPPYSLKPVIQCKNF